MREFVDSERERRVLAVMAHDGRDFAVRVLKTINPMDFGTPLHQVIASSVEKLVKIGGGGRGGTYSADDVGAACADHVSNADLHVVKEYIASLANINRVASIVLDDDVPVLLRLSESRSVVGALGEAHRYMMVDKDPNPNQVPVMIGSALRQRRELGATHVSESIIEAVRGIGIPGRGIMCGIGNVDRILNGARPGEYTVVGARPGDGKTQFACQWAIHAAESGKPVSYGSYEMSKEKITERLICILAKVDTQKIRQQGGPTKAEKSAIMDGAQRLQKLPIHIVSNESFLPAERFADIVAADADALGTKLVFVDYVQIMDVEPHIKKMGMEQTVAHCSSVLRNLSRTTDIPVVACAQLSRPEIINRPPTLADLRGSGQLEQDAWNVLLLHPQDSPAPPPGSPLEIHFIVAKQRSGAKGLARVSYEKSKATMGDW